MSPTAAAAHAKRIVKSRFKALRMDPRPVAAVKVDPPHIFAGRIYGLLEQASTRDPGVRRACPVAGWSAVRGVVTHLSAGGAAMSRQFVSKKDHRWVMRCDQCGHASRAAAAQADLPLEAFAQAGWFIAKLFGDQCPTCVATAGGLSAIETEAYIFTKAARS
jgi:hypothetical protein